MIQERHYCRRQIAAHRVTITKNIVVDSLLGSFRVTRELRPPHNGEYYLVRGAVGIGLKLGDAVFPFGDRAILEELG